MVNSSEENFFISPETNYIYFFDLMNVISYFLCIYYVPFKISYYKNYCININILDKIIFTFIDVVFIFDLITGFYRGYYNTELKLINDIKMIVNNYISNLFLYDLISALPTLSFLIYYFMDICLTLNDNLYIQIYKNKTNE